MSDGTPEGTSMVKEIWRPAGSRPGLLAVVGDWIPLTADGGINGCELLIGILAEAF